MKANQEFVDEVGRIIWHIFVWIWQGTSYWKCNFQTTLMSVSLSVGRLAGRMVWWLSGFLFGFSFQKKQGSYTWMLLFEHLFISVIICLSQFSGLYFFFQIDPFNLWQLVETMGHPVHCLGWTIVSTWGEVGAWSTKVMTTFCEFKHFYFQVSFRKQL